MAVYLIGSGDAEKWFTVSVQRFRLLQQLRDIHETDPDKEAAWTSGGVNGMQIGPEVVT